MYKNIHISTEPWNFHICLRLRLILYFLELRLVHMSCSDCRGTQRAPAERAELPAPERLHLPGNLAARSGNCRKVRITYSGMSSTVGVASMGLVVQACSWKGVRIPSRLAAIPLGAKAGAHGHSRFTVLVRSHCGAGLSKKKEMQCKNSF